MMACKLKDSAMNKTVTLPRRGAVRRRLSPVLIALGALALCGCASIKTGTDVDAATDFSRYRTASWMLDSILVAPESETISPLMNDRIRNAVAAQLARRGIQVIEDEARADLIIAAVIGAREKIDPSYYPGFHAANPVWCGPRCYDISFSTRTYTEGTLSIDLFDRRAGHPVWHGWAKKTITKADRDDPKQSVERALEQLFEGFPQRQ